MISRTTMEIWGGWQQKEGIYQEKINCEKKFNDRHASLYFNSSGERRRDGTIDCGKEWELCIKKPRVHSHFLPLLAFTQHVTSALAQYRRFHLIVDHEGLLCGVDIQTARSHFALGVGEQNSSLNNNSNISSTFHNHVNSF